MYEKKDSYRNYYSHSKINDYKYYATNIYQSPRDKSYLTGLQNHALKKKSKSDLQTVLNNNYFKPKLNNISITAMKQKTINLKSQRSQSYQQKDKQIGRKLQNYKIKKLQQKIKQSGFTQRSFNKYHYPQNKYQYPQSPRIVSSLSQSKKNLSARKPSDTKQTLNQSTKITAKQKHKYQNQKLNLQIDTQKLSQFFQNKRLQSNIPQTTKSILQYNQYNKIIKKNQMALRPFQQSKLMFKKNKQQQIQKRQHLKVESREQQKFQPSHLKKDNYTPKITKKTQPLISTNLQRKTVKKQKPQPLSIKDFQIYKQLGKGQNGKIYSAFHKKTGMVVALKHFQQNKIIIDYLIDQMKIQLFSAHSNVLAAFGYIIQKSSTIDTTGVYIDDEETKNRNKIFYNIYIIMEKGEFNLFSLIRKQKQLSQENTAVFTEQILQGLKYLHSYQIIHRDLKPENIIIVNGVCKITDFGWSVIGSQERETFCGTLEYVSPQVAVGSRYDNKIDIWSVGVLIFEMLTGEAPYDTSKILQNPKDEYRKRILSRLPLNCSFECKDLLSKLLKINPKQRISIEEALNHKWIKQALTRKTMNKNVTIINHELQKIINKNN